MPGKKFCSVIYANVRGLYGNLTELRARVAVDGADVIVLSETLVSGRRHPVELDLAGYSHHITSYVGCRQAARGMAFYTRNGFPCVRKQMFECKCHEMVCLKVSGKHINFYVLAVYRNPGADDSLLDCMLMCMAAVQEADRRSSFVFVGDFNAHHREWLHSVSNTDVHGRALLDFANSSGCQQLVNEPTHLAGNPLDLVLTDVPGVVSVVVGSPIGSSDHSSLHVKLVVNQPVLDFTVSREVYIKRGINWAAVIRDVEGLAWKQVYADEEPVDRMNELMLQVVGRHIGKKTLRLRSKDRPWFCNMCRVLYDDKQAAYRRWQRSRDRADYEEYTRARIRAQQFFNEAARRSDTVMRGRLLGVSDPHKWWRTLKGAIFGAVRTVPPLVNPSTGVLVSDPVQKAEVLLSAFEGKQSDRVLELPSTCHPAPTFCGVAFRSRKVRDLLSDLDAHGGTDSLVFFRCSTNRLHSLWLRNCPLCSVFCCVKVCSRSAGVRRTLLRYLRVHLHL